MLPEAISMAVLAYNSGTKNPKNNFIFIPEGYPRIYRYSKSVKLRWTGLKVENNHLIDYLTA